MTFPDTERTRLTEKVMFRVKELIPDISTFNYNRIYEEVYDAMKKAGASEEVIKEKKRFITVRTGGVKTSRNTPCHCGSGKKYKYCCGR